MKYVLYIVYIYTYIWEELKKRRSKRICQYGREKEMKEARKIVGHYIILKNINKNKNNKKKNKERNEKQKQFKTQTNHENIQQK